MEGQDLSVRKCEERVVRRGISVQTETVFHLIISQVSTDGAVFHNNMGPMIRYSREAGEVRVGKAIMKLRRPPRSRAGRGEDPAQKIFNSLQISKPREINIQGGVLRYVKSGYGHGQGDNPTQQTDKDLKFHIQDSPSFPTKVQPALESLNFNLGLPKSTDNSSARSLEDESDDDTGLPHKFDDGYYSPDGEAELEGPLAKCGLCRRTVSHTAITCPYLYHVPHNVSLPRGYERACKCCGVKDGHPGREWNGFAVRKYCDRCFKVEDHWADDPDCPKKKQRLS